MAFLASRSRKTGFNRRRCGEDGGAEIVNSANPVEEPRGHAALCPRLAVSSKAK